MTFFLSGASCAQWRRDAVCHNAAFRFLWQKVFHLLVIVERGLPVSILPPGSVVCQFCVFKLLQLTQEAQVWPRTWPSRPHCRQGVHPASPCHCHNVSHHQSHTAGHACNTVDETALSFQAGLVNEHDAISEELNQVLLGVVSSRYTQIRHVLQDRCSRVMDGQDVSDVVLCQQLPVSCIFEISKIQIRQDLVYSITHFHQKYQKKQQILSTILILSSWF